MANRKIFSLKRSVVILLLLLLISFNDDFYSLKAQGKNIDIFQNVDTTLALEKNKGNFKRIVNFNWVKRSDGDGNGDGATSATTTPINAENLESILQNDKKGHQVETSESKFVNDLDNQQEESSNLENNSKANEQEQSISVNNNDNVDSSQATSSNQQQQQQEANQQQEESIPTETVNQSTNSENTEEPLSQESPEQQQQQQSQPNSPNDNQNTEDPELSGEKNVENEFSEQINNNNNNNNSNIEPEENNREELPSGPITVDKEDEVEGGEQNQSQLESGLVNQQSSSPPPAAAAAAAAITEELPQPEEDVKNGKDSPIIYVQKIPQQQQQQQKTNEQLVVIDPNQSQSQNKNSNLNKIEPSNDQNKDIKSIDNNNVEQLNNKENNKSEPKTSLVDEKQQQQPVNNNNLKIEEEEVKNKDDEQKKEISPDVELANKLDEAKKDNSTLSTPKIQTTTTTTTTTNLIPPATISVESNSNDNNNNNNNNNKTIEELPIVDEGNQLFSYEIDNKTCNDYLYSKNLPESILRMIIERIFDKLVTTTNCSEKLDLKLRPLVNKKIKNQVMEVSSMEIELQKLITNSGTIVKCLNDFKIIKQDENKLNENLIKFSLEFEQNLNDQKLRSRWRHYPQLQLDDIPLSSKFNIIYPTSSSSSSSNPKISSKNKNNNDQSIIPKRKQKSLFKSDNSKCQKFKINNGDFYLELLSFKTKLNFSIQLTKFNETNYGASDKNGGQLRIKQFKVDELYLDHSLSLNNNLNHNNNNNNKQNQIPLVVVPLPTVQVLHDHNNHHRRNNWLLNVYGNWLKHEYKKQLSYLILSKSFLEQLNSCLVG